MPDGYATSIFADNGPIQRIPASGGTADLGGTVPDVSFRAKGGLLGLVSSPEFDQDRSVYVYQSAQPSNRVLRLTVSEITVHCTFRMYCWMA